MQTEFEITFFVDRLDSDTDAQNELFDLIARHAVAAGARLAPPKNAPYQPREDAALNIKDRSPDTVLTLAGIFVSLTLDERAAIAAKLTKASYEKGDVLVKPDDVLQSLFIVGSGVLSVTRPDNMTESYLADPQQASCVPDPPPTGNFVARGSAAWRPSQTPGKGLVGR